MPIGILICFGPAVAVGLLSNCKRSGADAEKKK